MPQDTHGRPPDLTHAPSHAPWAIKPGFDFGRVMAQTFSGLFRNIVPVLIAAFFVTILGGVILLATDAITQSAVTPDDQANLRESVVGLMTTAYLIFLGCFYYGFCMDVSYRTLLGYPVDLKDSLWRALPHALPLMAIAVLFWLGFTLGYLALIIPALILTAGWAIPGPAYMFGGSSITGSFGESWRLTRGYKWMVWLVNFVVGLIAQLGAVFMLILFVIVIVIFQDAELTTDPDAEMNQMETAFWFFALLFVSNLLAGLYASMKAAIYVECVDLQDIWERNKAGVADNPPHVEI